MSYVSLSLMSARPLSVAVAMLAAMGLVGYAVEWEAAYRPVADGSATHPWTFVAGALLAVALCARRRPGGFAMAGAALAAAICLMSFDPELFHLSAPFGSAVARDHVAGLSNGMGANTAAMLLLLALSVILYGQRLTQLAQLTAFVALAFPTTAITGYMYGLAHFYGNMSLVTAILGLGLGLSAAARAAHRPPLRTLLNTHLSGRLARLQILLGCAVPFNAGLMLARTADGDQGDLLGIVVVATSWFVTCIITLSAVFHERSDHLRRLRERDLARNANTDALTGLINRRRFQLCCEHEVQRSRRTNQPLSLVMIDVDHFKRINDSGGHVVGDYVLQTIATVMKKRIRATDTLGRLGGEEFALLLPDTPAAGAYEVAESLRRLVESARFEPWPGHDWRVTASFGCATLLADETQDELAARADAALYAAKRLGRNRTIMAESAVALAGFGGRHAQAQDRRLAS